MATQAQRKAAGRERPVFQKTTEEFRELAEALRAEAASWPGVRQRAMFGMTMLYHGEKPFCLVPKTRRVHEGDAVLLKFNDTSAARKHLDREGSLLRAGHVGPGAGWVVCLVRSKAELPRALQWMVQAHAEAN